MTPRILVVDDDSLIRRIMRDTLSTLPADISEAKDGDEALRLARAERPDLIFLDTMMPGMDGFQVAELLKQEPLTAAIPLVFVSALGTASHKVRGLDLGAEDYMAKPIDPEELKARVRSILRRTRPPVPAPEPAAPTVASGKLQAMPLPSLVRWLEMERRSARLLLVRAGEVGEITFADGRISHAVQGPRRGEAALYQLLTWREGGFEILPAPEGEMPAGGELTRANEDLLQEGSRRMEEATALRAGLPGSEALLEIPAALRTAAEAVVPQDGVSLMALLDGKKDVGQILAGSPFDGWMTLKILQRLLRVGALGWVPTPGASGQAEAPRRSILRLLADVPVQYQSLRALQEASRFTLSARGMFVQTPTPFEVGEQVLLRFQLPGGATWITAVGQVVWRNADAKKSKPEDLGMMLQFIQASPEVLAAIEDCLTHGIVAQIRAALESP
ncbi:MAG TPA: response regulator [Candidatus Methylomirabilis sp.]|nr:response regulator [Candidatus Methylomirabilis sp.]